MTDPELPRSARGASWLGKFAPSCALAGLIGIQVGALPPLGGFLIFQLGLLCALLALISGAVAFVATRDQPQGPGRTSAWLGLASGMLMIAATVLAAGSGLGEPPINDITTNLQDPPQFATAKQVPAYAGRQMGYPPEFVEIVRDHYPDLKPILASGSLTTTFEKSIAAARDLGWQVVFSVEGAQQGREARFDAQVQSRAFKFIDDVTVRVRSAERGTSIDVRSKSRDGKGDLGANAAHIRAFAAEMEK